MTRRLGRAGLDVLLAQPEPTRPGGRHRLLLRRHMALELARGGADLKAVVGFHSGLAHGPPRGRGNIRGKVLVCIGADDPMVPLEQRHRLRGRDAGRRCRLADERLRRRRATASPTRPADELGMPGIDYHEPTDERSWRAMIDLFAESID